MTLPRTTAQQLHSMAAGADRANRPTLLVVVGGAMVAIAIVVLLVGGARLASGQRRLANELADAENLRNRVQQYVRLENARPDLAALYPSYRFMDVHISEIAQREINPDNTNPAPVQVGLKSTKTLQADSRLNRSDVAIDITRDVELERILAFVNTLETDPRTGRGFVSEFTIRPNNTGWVGEIQYTIYEASDQP